ncbi:MAG: hypothetical protein LBK26_00540 [Rickettsiales bacterium]|jgi:hypothetical protein|nr:hypothetical protein [Rickettsiales bacterium]
MNKIIKGGFLSGYRTYVTAAAGILSAVATYLSGDTDIFNMLQTIFMLGGIYFLRASVNNELSKEKECKSQKNSKTRTERLTQRR